MIELNKLRRIERKKNMNIYTYTYIYNMYSHLLVRFLFKFLIRLDINSSTTPTLRAIAYSTVSNAYLLQDYFLTFHVTYVANFNIIAK